MKLIGSTTSPFVRRIRLFLGDAQYEFVNLDIYGDGRDQLRQNNPALKIPVLLDGDQKIYDSRVIARYLSALSGAEALSWTQENYLTLIDAANDAAVILLLSKRSGLDVDQDILFYRLQHERLHKALQALSDGLAAGVFDNWGYPEICLYCLVDWLDFRNLIKQEDFKPLLAFRDARQGETMVAETDPRLV